MLFIEAVENLSSSDGFGDGSGSTLGDDGVEEIGWLFVIGSTLRRDGSNSVRFSSCSRLRRLRRDGRGFVSSSSVGFSMISGDWGLKNRQGVL